MLVSRHSIGFSNNPPEAVIDVCPLHKGATRTKEQGENIVGHKLKETL